MSDERSYDELVPWSIKHRGSGLEAGVAWVAPGSRVEMSDHALWAHPVHIDDVEGYREQHRPDQITTPPAGADYPQPGPVAVPADPDGPSDPEAVEIGDVVHYVARGSADGRFPPVCRAAWVTELGGPAYVAMENDAGEVAARADARFPAIGLAVMNPTGLFFHPVELGAIEHDPGHYIGNLTATGPLCDGLEHGPGTWHHPRRRPLPDLEIARAAARGTRRMERRA